MHVPVTKMSVEGNLGQDIGMSVRGTGEGSIIQLAGVRGCQRAGQHNRTANELFGVLDGEPERPSFIGVEHDAELRRTSPSQTHLEVRVNVQTGKNVSWQGREAIAIRSQKTPRLASQKLPSASLHIHPIQTHAWGVAVAGYEDVPRLKADEVRL